MRSNLRMLQIIKQATGMYGVKAANGGFGNLFV